MEAYWLPRSLCTNQPAAGLRLKVAISKASFTRMAVMRDDMAQPTPAREYRSIEHRQIRPAFPRRNRGDVARINGIRCADFKWPVQVMGSDR